MSFSFTLRTELRVGAGAAREVIPERLAARGARHACVILDAGVESAEHPAALVEALRAVVERVQVLVNDAREEPSYDHLETMRGRVEPGVDAFVAVGGGSTLDLAKAVSVLVTNPGPAISYRGFDLITEDGIPLIAVPTTAGTGSEVTPNAVFTDTQEERKLGINTARYLPELAVLDPLMVASAPRPVLVSAGMDALVHSIESYVTRGATPMSRDFSRLAFGLLAGNLARAVEAPDDLEAVQAVQLGAFYAGAALFNSGGGPVGALSYPLGVHFKVPHGMAGAVFLAPVHEWNLEQGYTGYAPLADALPEPPPPGASDAERAAAVVTALRDLSTRLGVPTTLAEWGVTRDDLPALVEETYGLQGALEGNPVPVPESMLRDLYEGMVS